MGQGGITGCQYDAQTPGLVPGIYFYFLHG
jgi:hypothetical protein